MMGFSSQKYRKASAQKRWKINPVWRGIGCALVILVPIMAWFGTSLFLQTNQKIPIPYQLKQHILIPFVHVAAIDKVILDINQFFVSANLLWGQLFFTVILTFLGFGIMTVIYGFMYQIAGPPRYGPFDIPPNKIHK